MKCPACGHDEMKHRHWDKVVSFHGKTVTVHDVSGFRCPECGEAVFDDASYDRVAAAGDALVKAARKSNPPEVWIIREKLGLTQAEAGKVFGGGVNAFSRYERGVAKPGATMRKLLKVSRASSRTDRGNRRDSLIPIRLPAAQPTVFCRKLEADDTLREAMLDASHAFEFSSREK